MRRFMTTMATILVALSLASGAMAQLRGKGRMQGNVTDKSTGKPIQGATITVSLPSGNTVPIVTKTDAKGHWSAIGMTNGVWNVDIAAPGYATAARSLSVSETQQLPMLETGLAPEVKQEAAAISAPTTPLVPKEAIDAIKEGQELLRVNVGDTVTNTQSTGPGSSTGVSHTVTAEEARDNAKRAVADLEKALPMLTIDKPEVKQVHDQVMQVMAQAYYRAGDVKNAIGTLEKIVQADPANTASSLLLANLYLENGQLDAGKAQLEKLPPTAITDPTAYINVGILFLNKKNPTDSITYFTKAIDMNPKAAEGYYYRGLAEAQLKKTPQARADFEQVLVLAPASQEAKDSKAMLDGLPKK